MKIVYMGTPDFAVPPLAALVKNGYEVAAVVTQPDKPKGRGKTLLPTPVKEEAMKHEIPVYQPLKVRDPEFVETLKELAPDMIIVAAFGQIIPKTILDMPKYGCLNIHASLLPKYRGAAPIQQAVIDGEKESGVTIMKMGVGLDTGDMISQAVVTLAEDETGGSLFDRLSLLGGELILSTLDKLEAGTLVPEKQDHEKATYVKKISKSMGDIDWTMDAAAIERLIRGLNPWPSAYTSLHGKTLKLWDGDVLKETTDARPGEVVLCDPRRLVVAAGEGLLSIRQLQLEGKKRMDVETFLRGYAVNEGEVLGE